MKQTLKVLFVVVLSLILTSFIYTQKSYAQTGCAYAPTSTSAISMSFSVSETNTYQVWSRLFAPDTNNNSLYLQVDNGCPINVGDSSSIQVNQLSWVNYQDGNTANLTTMNLSSGSHTLKIIGREIGVGIDRLIFTTNTSCIPTGTGDNCPNPTETPIIQVTNTPAPSVVPTDTPVVSATSIPTATPVPTVTPTLQPTNTPVPLTVTPVTSAYVVYDDVLQNKWTNGSYKSTLNFGNISPVYAGTKSISWKANSGYAAFELNAPSSFNTTGYNHLQLAIYATKSNMNLNVLAENPSFSLLKKVSLANYGGYPTINAWKVYTIPLSALGAANRTVGDFTVENNSSSAQPVAYFDQIVLTK